MKIYLSGPMNGMPELNFSVFTVEAKRLRNAGHSVFNPCEEAPHPDWQWAEWIISDLIVLMSGDFDAVALLPGWENSRGCAVEVAFAKGLGVEVKTVEEI